MDKFYVENINKVYSNFSLKDLSFDLKEGYITGFIGPNGSGKTTTIKSILNFIKIDSGEVLYNNKKTVNFDYLKDIGIVTDSTYLPKDWRIREVNEVMNIGYENWDSNLFYELLQMYKIDKDLKVKSLSRGMSTKLMMAVALSHKATCLILDEPTSGLDPSAREEFRDIIQDYMDKDSKNTVLFSTHITSDLEQIADYILFIMDGKRIFYGTKDDLMDEFRLIKGDEGDFSLIDRDKIIGKKKYLTRCEALINKRDLNLINDNFIIEQPSLDNIMTFFKRGEYNEWCI